MVGKPAKKYTGSLRGFQMHVEVVDLWAGIIEECHGMQSVQE